MGNHRRRQDNAAPPDQNDKHPIRVQNGMDGGRSCSRSWVVQSRRDNNLAGRFPDIVAAGRRLGDVVLDGELVALREGKLDFGALASSPGLGPAGRG
jgi:ATP-dependent DNA ligase